MALKPGFSASSISIIQSFLRHHLEDSGREGFVLGMSGGLDSSVVAKLAADAVGARKVLGLSLPLQAGESQDEKDARGWAKRLGIRFRTIEIGALVDSIVRHLAIPEKDLIGRGNVQARVRMILLYQLAHQEERLVLGTGNKSELLAGYFSKFGDGGCDFHPIGDLYKTQVREMARHLGLPPSIIEKVPSAGLWAGQTDEGELGIAYHELDQVLLGMELEMAPEEIARRSGLTRGKVAKVAQLVRRSIHKRKMPLIPKVGIRTLGLDWRE